MKTVRKEMIVPFDVDETLVLAERPDTLLHTTDIVYVVDPINAANRIKRYKHDAMIRLLMEEHHRGSYILVWSRGGYAWAENVILALNLGAYVDTVMSKPHCYMDDVPIEDWLKNRVYIKPGTVYK